MNESLSQPGTAVNKRSRITRKHTIPISVFILVVLAFAIRTFHVASINYRPVSDMDAYLTHSRIIGTDDPRVIYTTLFPPGYTWFLWCIEHIVELARPHFALLIQTFLAALATVMIFKIGKWIYGPRVGIIAAGIYALYKPAVLSAGLLQSETLTEFFFITAVFSLLGLLRSAHYWWFILCVVTTSLAIHTRVNIISIVPLMMLLLLYYAVVSKGRNLRIRFGIYMLLLPVLLIASFIPWSIRNTRIHDYPTFISSNGGQNLLQGNNAFTEGGWFAIQNIKDEAIQEALKVPSLERPATYSRLATDFIKENPAYELFYLIPKRVEYTFFLRHKVFWPWQMVIESNYWTHPFGPYFQIPMVPYSVIIILGLIGFCIRGRGPFRFIIPLFWLSILPLILMVHGNGRFHYISDWLLILSAAALLSQAFHRIPVHVILRTSLITIAGIAGFWSAMQWARFGGANKLENESLVTVSEKVKEAHGGTMTFTSEDASKTSALQMTLAELPVSPGTTSHLLLSADISVVTTTTAFNTPNILVEFQNADNEKVEQPRHATELIHPGLHMNPNTGFEHYWRILNVPGSATRIILRYNQEFTGNAELKNLSLRGPVW